MPDDLDVLAGGMKYLQHLLVGHQRKERLQIDALGQCVHHHGLLGARDLDHAEQGIIGRLPQELGIDGNGRVPGQALAGRGEVGSGRNQIHEQSMTLAKAFCRKR